MKGINDMNENIILIMIDHFYHQVCNLLVSFMQSQGVFTYYLLMYLLPNT